MEPIYEESEGLQVTGAIFDGSSAISWNFWDSEEDMNAAVEKLQAALDSESESELFDGSTIAYMGPVYAGKLFIDFNEGDTPCLLYTSPSPRDSGQSRMPSSA